MTAATSIVGNAPGLSWPAQPCFGNPSRAHG